MKFAHQVPAVLAAVVAMSVLPGRVGAQTSTTNTDFLPNGGSAKDCTVASQATDCAAGAYCEEDYAGTGIDYCICLPGYTGDGLKKADGNTGCNNINECEDNTLNDCIAVSSTNGGNDEGTICVDVTSPVADGDLYTCPCPAGTEGSAANSVNQNDDGGDGKTLFSGGSGCPATPVGVIGGTLVDCEAACISPDASCFENYLGAGAGKHSCACNDGYKGDGAKQPESTDGCTRLAPVLGEQQTLGTASQKIDDAIGILDTYLNAKKEYEEKQCQFVETTDACTAATALYNETLAEYNRATFEYNQAVNYEEQKLADRNAANALDGTAAERERLESAAEDAYQEAVTAKGVAETAKNDANLAQQYANGNMTDVCDDVSACDDPGDALCVGQATAEQTSASNASNTAKIATEANNLIPEILTPDTANPYQDPFDEFVYGDSDGDLIPDKFDACPTQMGLRRVRRAQGFKTSTSVGGVAYADDQDVWTNFTDPGPQDFCPSGCPETDELGNILDTDGDGIRDCEDRCPFVPGIRYNHAWTKDKWTDASNNDLIDLDRNLDYNGCPDFDKDGIPDIFDQCPGCVWDDENNVCTAVAINDNSQGGRCYSGCPDPGDDPATCKPFDTDLDGVPDCFDRCPGTYAPNGNITIHNLTTTHGCPDLDGMPDYLDYCPVNPGSAVFTYTRKLEGASGTTHNMPASLGYWQPGPKKWLTILGCPDRDGDFVPDTVDLCDSCAYPNQDTTDPYQENACNRDEQGWLEAEDNAACNDLNIDGVVVVDRVGCPLDSDQDGVFDGIDMCDGTIHSANDIHDEHAVVYKASDDGYTAGSNSTDGVLGCPKDDDGDGVANGIDQCPDVGGCINEDGCPIDSDGDGVSDCASDVGGDNSVLTTSAVLPTWPFTLGHISSDACHSTAVEPTSAVAFATNCCNVAYDNCDGTPKFVDVTNAYAPSATDSPVEATETGMGCSVDTDGDGVDDGRDRCPYSTPVEVNYFKGLDPAGKAVDVSGLISRDTFGCIVTLPAAWDINFVDVTTNTTEDDNSLDGITDEDGDANPDLQILFTTPKLLWDVQESRGVASPPYLQNITDKAASALVNTYDEGTANELIKATVFDYSCTKKFDDSATETDPTKRLLPAAVIRGVGQFAEETLSGENLAGDKNIPEGSQPFYVDVEINPDGLVGSEIWKIQPPFDEASIEFCLRVDLYSDNEESVNFMELKTIVKIDMTQGFKVSDTEVKRNEATTEETQIDIQCPLAACHCQGEDFQYKCVADDDSTDLNDEFVKQDDAMNVCVRFADPSTVPAYVRMTDLKMFTCTQGTLSHTPVLDFVRSQDGLTSVDIFDNGALVGDNDRMVVVSTNLPSAFFGTTASTVDCEGTLVYDFTQNADVNRRRTAEASIRAIAPPAKSDEERKLNEAEEEFSVKVSLAPANSESSSMNAGLIAGVTVAGVIGVAAVGLLVTKAIPAVRVSKMATSDGRRLSYETDHSISDNSPNHYLDNNKGHVA